jgi:uncharacterized protein
MHALIITFGAFILILVLARFRVPLAIAILAGSVAVGSLLGLDMTGLFQAMISGATSPQAASLVVITILIIGLSVLMRESGLMASIVMLTNTLLRHPFMTIMAMPALIGLLPMPGGAIFSAPMVETAGSDTGISPARLSSINYWFRHIWEFFWPLYPGVILAMSLTGFDIPAWTGLMVAGTIAMLAAGLIMFRGLPRPTVFKTVAAPAGTRRKLLRATSSIWIILVIWTVAYMPAGALSTSFLSGTYAGAFLQHSALMLGLAGSIVWTMYTRNLGLRPLLKAFIQPTVYSMAGLILSVLIFQNVLVEVNAPRRIAEELESFSFPLVLIIVLLPFISGFVTGIAIGFVGPAFPIILTLIAHLDNPGSSSAYIFLAFAFGHLGQMMTPLHICQIVSNRYFRTTYAPVYRFLLPTGLVAALLYFGCFLLLRIIV